MTGRRPPGTPTGSWVEQQVQEATERGAFDDLPLAGQPLRHLEKPTGDYDYVAQVAAREGIDPVSLLPPSLAVLREIEDLSSVLDLLRDEDAVRSTVEELNRRIRDLLLMPQGGPPLRTGMLDLEAQVEGWRQRRAVRDGCHAADDGCHGSATPRGPAATRGGEPPHGIGRSREGRRRWFRRRG